MPITKSIVVLLASLGCLCLTSNAAAQPAGTASENFVVISGAPIHQPWTTEFDGIEAKALLLLDRVAVGVEGEPIERSHSRGLATLLVRCRGPEFGIFLEMDNTHPIPDRQNGRSVNVLGSIMTRPSVEFTLSDATFYSITHNDITREQFLSIIVDMHAASDFRIEVTAPFAAQISVLLPRGGIVDAGHMDTPDAMGWLFQRCSSMEQARRG